MQGFVEVRLPGSRHLLRVLKRGYVLAIEVKRLRKNGSDSQNTCLRLDTDSATALHRQKQTGKEA